MSLLQALTYFLREAAISLVRSFKVSLLAVLTIALSLFMGGIFLLVTGNLSRLVGEWEGQARLTVYLAEDVTDEARAALRDHLAAAAFVTSVEEVSGEVARERFRRTFPSLADLVEGWQEDPLPASLEAELVAGATTFEGYADWAAALRELPGATLVDDDRDWLDQLDTLVAVARSVGLGLGGVLLAAAVLTVASVIRLTIYMHREEIATMRLVGATEFFIRGPFYVEGLLQGLLGGSLAVAALWLVQRSLVSELADGLVGSGLLAAFLPWRELLFLVLLGALAGLAGAVVSLRREDLGQAP